MPSFRSVFFPVLTIFFISGGAVFADVPSFLFMQDNGLNNTMSVNIPDKTFIFLEMNQGDDPSAKSSSFPAVPAWKLHKYLGYTTILLAAVTAVSSGSKHFHWAAAYGTAGAAALTVTTGTISHGQRFRIEDGLFTRDNAHILLGTIGAIGWIAAVVSADSEGGGGHAGAGIISGTAMALSILTIRW